MCSFFLTEVKVISVNEKNQNLPKYHDEATLNLYIVVFARGLVITVMDDIYNILVIFHYHYCHHSYIMLN